MESDNHGVEHSSDHKNSTAGTIDSDRVEAVPHQQFSICKFDTDEANKVRWKVVFEFQQKLSSVVVFYRHENLVAVLEG